MAQRHFTPEEANELLEQVRPIAEELVAHRRAMAVTATRQARLVQRIAGNGGDFDPQETRTPEEGVRPEDEAVLRRSVITLIIFVGVLSALLVIPQVRAVATGILASSAVIGLVVGFAAQRTIGNFIAGLLIAFSQPIRLGDWIEFEGYTGEVEEIGLTYTFIRTSENARLVIPNEKIASDTIRNSSIRSREKLAQVSVQVPLDSDLEAVVGLLRDVTQDDRAEVEVTALDEHALLLLSV